MGSSQGNLQLLARHAGLVVPHTSKILFAVASSAFLWDYYRSRCLSEREACIMAGMAMPSTNHLNDA